MRSKQLTTHACLCQALVLAAGQGKRFGSDKRQAHLPGGQTVLSATLALALEHFDVVTLVLRPDDDHQAMNIDPRVRVIRARQANVGLSASLAAGIAALQDSSAQAAAVLLGDMPWIAQATLRSLCARAHAERIVMPVYQGQRGHPVIFGRAFWAALEQVKGDEGGRQVIQANAPACIRVEVDDPGVLLDIDTPADLSAGISFPG
ncbi:nucleotidyltransferase family protein [Pseudomonas putida]|uniref:nucleotidyltransferase family protein n=1 Tax=Pseudomonas putida TaxID=303 RepID=UPI001059C971|nr:nucleotidyltransferase family protein [Pseudomonas putida]TDJ75884.1 nucleotidyltransferase family protein [Pseudomonas putida]